MRIIFFGSKLDIIDELKDKHNIDISQSYYDLESLNNELEKNYKYILIVDYDSISSEFNKLISTGTLPQNSIILEKSPELVTGKMLISRGAKAYGNIRMLTIHFTQMLETINKGKVWTYPELTAALIKDTAAPTINEDAIKLIQNRLSPKEIEVVYFIIDGLINDAIALKLNITPRTVKAHVSSIFSKLHVSDRISLILLLK